MSFLLDTDICSAEIKGNPLVYGRFIQHGGRLHVSTVTLAELFTWARRARTSAKILPQVLRLCQDLHVIPVDQAVAQKFGEIRAKLLDAGLPVPQMDLMLAVTALEHGLTLVTHNAADYANIPGLMMVDWLIP